MENIFVFSQQTYLLCSATHDMRYSHHPRIFHHRAPVSTREKLLFSGADGKEQSEQHARWMCAELSANPTQVHPAARLRDGGSAICVTLGGVSAAVGSDTGHDD